MDDFDILYKRSSAPLKRPNAMVDVEIDLQVKLLGAWLKEYGAGAGLRSRAVSAFVALRLCELLTEMNGRTLEKTIERDTEKIKVMF
jgi:hypothetical protein